MILLILLIFRDEMRFRGRLAILGDSVGVWEVRRYFRPENVLGIFVRVRVRLRRYSMRVIYFFDTEIQ